MPTLKLPSLSTKKLSLTSIGLLFVSIFLIFGARIVISQLSLMAVLSAPVLFDFVPLFCVLGYVFMGAGVAGFLYVGLRSKFQMDKQQIKTQSRKLKFAVVSLTCLLVLSSCLMTAPVVSANTIATTGYYLATPLPIADWYIGNYSNGNIFAINGSSWANLMTFPSPAPWASATGNYTQVWINVLAATSSGSIYAKEVAFPQSLMGSIPVNTQVICNYQGVTYTYINPASSLGSPYTVSVGQGLNSGYYVAADSGNRICWSSSNATKVLSNVKDAAKDGDTIIVSKDVSLIGSASPNNEYYGFLGNINIGSTSGYIGGSFPQIVGSQFTTLNSIDISKICFYTKGESANTQANVAIYNYTTVPTEKLLESTVKNLTTTAAWTDFSVTPTTLPPGTYFFSVISVTGDKVYCYRSSGIGEFYSKSGSYSTFPASSPAYGGPLTQSLLSIYASNGSDLPSSANVICIGDSITERYAELLGFANPNGLFTYEAGYAGWTTSTMIGTYDSTIKLRNDSVVVVLMGVNDIRGDATAATIKTNLFYMWNDSLSRGKSVYALTIMPFKGVETLPWSEARQSVLEDVNNWIKTTAPLYGITVIDTYALFVDPNNSYTMLAAYDSGDHIHQNQAGSLAICNAIYSALNSKTATDVKLIVKTAGANLLLGQSVYLKDDCKYYLSDANSTATVGYGSVYLNVINATAGGKCLLLESGEFSSPKWHFTPGQPVYADALSGVLTQVKSTDAGLTICPVGFASSRTSIHWQVTGVYTENS